METKGALFKYEQLNSDELASALSKNGVVEVWLSKKRTKRIMKVINVVNEINRASESGDVKIKKIEIYMAMLGNFLIMIFHPKLIEIVTFFTLKKPKFSLGKQEAHGCIIKFEKL